MLSLSYVQFMLIFPFFKNRFAVFNILEPYCIMIYPNLGRYIRTMLHYTKKEAEVCNYCAHFRIFDVTSELYCAMLRRRRRFEKTLAFEGGKYPGALRASCFYYPG